MAFQLAAVTGPLKGQVWPFGDQGLLVGRSATCDVSLKERFASRRHFRIELRDGQFWFVDLESSNPALVNGKPEKEMIVGLGDEIAVGSTVFLVTDDVQTAWPGSGADGDIPSDAFPTEGDGEPFFLENDPKTIWRLERSPSVAELIRLYEMISDLTQAGHLDDLLMRLERRFHESFETFDLWIVRTQDDGRVTLSGGLVFSTTDDMPPMNMMGNIATDHRGFLVTATPQGGDGQAQTITFVVPLLVAGRAVAVLALRTVPAPGRFPEATLGFLVLLGHTLAPLITALEHGELLRRENERLRSQVGDSMEIVGASRAMARVRHEIGVAARSDLHVLITGETGTGKELAAHLLHAHSGRSDRPLVIVNCAAIPRELLESELFGYVKGAFTGASGSSPGLLAEADGGTLFLDEVGDLSLDNQARILRVVESGTYRPVGGQQERRVALRIVAATNKNLKAGVEDGSFREDLYYRLAGYEITIPPLREHPSDIPLLAEHFFKLGRPRAKRPLTGFAPEALEYLQTQPWRGNIRGLRNNILRAIACARGAMITVEDVRERDEPEYDAVALTASLTLADAEKRHIEDVLRRCGRRIGKTATALQIARSTLYEKLTLYKIPY
ncbi:MAG: sigma 54-dependent Fis family transcriptional regulator [Candidatus Hydrogenedentes bacterium]|nr:sigma 54-dependent Fis family transcriptional regulator [Candidatus Hydrogenedentota bacterium]